MNAIYRTHFEVRACDPIPALHDAVADICWKWLFDPRRGYSQPSPSPSGCAGLPETELKPTTITEAVVVPTGGSIRWILRLAHPDQHDEAGLWRTELGIERTSEGRVFFSCSLYLGRTDRSLAPFRRHITRPRVVLDVLRKFDGYGDLPLTSKPLPVKDDPAYVEAYLKLLLDNRRQHPIVYVSMHEQSRRPLFDISRLADHLAGMAYVVVDEHGSGRPVLEQRLPRSLQAFDGAVRLYWPGFSLRSRPYDHPLWTTHRIISIQTRGRDAFSKRLLADIAGVAVTTVPESMLTWAKAEEAIRQQAITQARAAEDVKGLLTLYEQDNIDLRVKVAGLKAELQTKADELFQARKRITALENSADESDPAEQYLAVETVADAIEQAATRWPEALAIALNSKSDDESTFQPASEVLQAIEWLATTYRNAKMGQNNGINLDHDIRQKIPGWSYSPHQSDLTVTTFKEWYECRWECRAYTVSQHIGTGTSKKPEETIRIAFAWDKQRKKVIVGFIGQHQKTTKS